MSSAKVLQLVAVGNVPESTLRWVEEPLRVYLGLSTTVHRTVLAEPKYAFNKDRDQYHCNPILKRMAGMLESKTDMLMGITTLDLFVPDSPFVFGEADRESRVALLSAFRLNGSPDQTRRRFQVEATHQAGHLMGLSFCEDARCVMFMAQAVAECDRKNVTPCSLCRNELAKLKS